MKMRSIKFKFIIYGILFGLIIMSTSILTVYYWSFTYFEKLFEDQIISTHTLNKKETLGVKNEWILGVSTNSIEVVQGVHGDELATIIEDRAQSQKESNQFYHENLSDKKILCNIKLDTQNGETIYQYSIIRDIYAEIFPKICLYFICFTIFLIFLSICYTNFISNRLYQDIYKLRVYTKKITKKEKIDEIVIDSEDKELQNLVNDLKILKDTLDREEALRQSTLQYISHEMKTPIMIIEGYTSSAKDNLFPKGDLNSTLDTILAQAYRIKQKVRDLITIIKVESNDYYFSTATSVNIYDTIQEILILLKYNYSNKKVELNIPSNYFIECDKEQLKIIFENLITNQIKYSDTFFSITCEKKEDTLYMHFFNDGEKIGEQIKPYLFSPFVKEYHGGSGLGLSICKTIISKLNGDIYLEDTTTGNLFTVKFNSFSEK